MMAAKTGSSPQPGRLEPFLLVSLLLHGALLLVLSRVVVADRFVLPMGEGAVVRVIPVAPAGDQTLLAVRPARESSAAGGSGAQNKKPSPPAAAKAVADKPNPRVTPRAPAPAPPPAKAQPTPGSASTSPPPKPASQVLTSARGPAVAVAAAPREPSPSAIAARQETTKEVEAQGAIARKESAGTGGVGEGNPPPGPPEPDLSAAMVVDGSRPVYPKNAVTYGEEGQVLLEVTVNADGTVGSVAVKQGSGSSRLDTIAERWVRDHWRFKPSSVKRPYRLTVMFEFAITRDEQGRAWPNVGYRLVSERVTYL